MKKNYLYGALALVLLMSSCAKELEQTEAEKQTPTIEQTPEIVSGELFVKFSAEVGEILDAAGLTRSASTRSGVVSVDDVLAAFDTYQIERVFPYNESTEAKTRESEMHLWYLVRFDEKYDVQQVASQLAKLGEVKSVSANRTIKRAYTGKAMPLTQTEMSRMQSRTRATGYAFNDELLPVQWDMINRGNLFAEKSIVGADVQCEEAWKLCTGDESIIVAILDEGVDWSHPELAENMWRNPNEIDRSHKDNDGNGYAGDYYGYNFVQNTGVITFEDIDDTGHGSHVAGVIAARNDNGIGISSIAGGDANGGGVKIMSCQIFSGNMASNTLAEVQAIKYAADNGAVILQCSWGVTSGAANSYLYGQGYPDEDSWVYYSPLEKIALDYFLNHAGSPNGVIEGGLAVFASGNENAPMAGFPGAYSECISVNATAADFTPAVYSNYGEFSDISAPGGDVDYYYEYGEGEDRGKIGSIISTLPIHVSETGYGYMEGTSMACPHVSGVIALGLSYANKLRLHFTAAEFKKLLYATCTDINDYLYGEKFYYQYVSQVGEVNPRQLVLSDYRNRMGGQANAARLLNAVAGAGTPMAFPNLYVALNNQTTAIPAMYFVNGESKSYTVQVADTTVATAQMSGNKLIVTGLKVGTTKATITPSGAAAQSFTITVRNTANGNGWL